MPNGTEDIAIAQHIEELKGMVNGPKVDGIASKINKKQVFLIGYSFDLIKWLSGELKSHKATIENQQGTIGELVKCIERLEAAELIKRVTALEANQVRALPKMFWAIIDNRKPILWTVTALVIIGGAINWEWELIVKALSLLM